MSEMTWDVYLVAEHEMIERAMAVLKEQLVRIEKGEEDTVTLRRALDFLLEFGDKIHNKKEEMELFPLMEQRGIPREQGPLGVMLMEHQAERALLASMLTRVATLAKAEPSERQRFQREALDYLQIRANHIWKENDVLYPMARRIFQPGDDERLLAAFQEINLAAYGPAAWDKFQQMASEVEQSRTQRKKLIEGLSYAQIDAIMESMPFEVTFVDADDTVAYFNRLDKEKLFPRTRSVIGRKVEKCHPEHSVDTVRRIVAGFKDKTNDKAEFWIDFKGDKILIRYFPVYDDDDRYMGVLEVTQAIGAIQKIEGSKRLLDW